MILLKHVWDRGIFKKVCLQGHVLLVHFIAVTLSQPSLMAAGRAGGTGNDGLVGGQVVGLSPEESLKTMQLPPGYRLELVLGDADINDPVAVSFDGNGGMFVAEFRSYMQDADGTNQHIPTSRVSYHVSSKGDGLYDKHTIFADKLVLPRVILPLDRGQLLIGESDTRDIYLYTDINGDGVSDKKELWYAGGPYRFIAEHQPSGLVWCLDNWIYTTINTYRLRWTPKGPIKETIPSNDGQWGLTQDNFGKQWPMNARGERGPVNVQVPLQYGDSRISGEFAEGFAEVWPLVGLADVQPGIGRFRPSDKTLNHFTGTAGVDVYRGDRLPKDLQGDLFFGEPVGRLVRRAKITAVDGVTTLSNPYQSERTEFLRSSDPCFRPVNLATAPDGTMYIVDMYRGLIQEWVAVKRGSYLRDVVEKYGMAKVIGHGRIWRVVHESIKPGAQPRLLDQTTSELVRNLDSANGWWRDTAQKLIVLRQDKSVVPALTQMVESHQNTLARVHALWTLEGLNALETRVLRKALTDPHPQMRIAAIRASESFLKAGDMALKPDIQAQMTRPEPEVVIQAMLTTKAVGWTDGMVSIHAAAAATSARGVREIGQQLVQPYNQSTAGIVFTPDQQKTMKAGGEIYNTLCISCHGSNGKGAPVPGAESGIGVGNLLAPSLWYNPVIISGRPEAAIYSLLNGRTGRKYASGEMMAFAGSDDEWIAAVLSFVRNSFGNCAGLVSSEQVASARMAIKHRDHPWTVAELSDVVPQPLINNFASSSATLSASHNAETVGLAMDRYYETRYTTAGPQTRGMWVQVELSAETLVAALTMESALSPDGYPREFEITTSLDGKNWSSSMAKGHGSRPVTDVTFDPVKAKYVRITLTESDPANAWSIHELQVFAPPKKPVGP